MTTEVLRAAVKNWKMTNLEPLVRTGNGLLGRDFTLNSEPISVGEN